MEKERAVELVQEIVEAALRRLSAASSAGIAQKYLEEWVAQYEALKLAVEALKRESCDCAHEGGTYCWCGELNCSEHC